MLLPNEDNTKGRGTWPLLFQMQYFEHGLISSAFTVIRKLKRFPSSPVTSHLVHRCQLKIVYLWSVSCDGERKAMWRWRFPVSHYYWCTLEFLCRFCPFLLINLWFLAENKLLHRYHVPWKWLKESGKNCRAPQIAWKNMNLSVPQYLMSFLWVRSAS